MRVKVDWNLCDGNGVCAIEAPEVFELDDDDNLILVVEEPGEQLRPKVAAAARVCPKHAIEIEGQC